MHHNVLIQSFATAVVLSGDFTGYPPAWGASIVALQADAEREVWDEVYSLLQCMAFSVF